MKVNSRNKSTKFRHFAGGNESCDTEGAECAAAGRTLLTAAAASSSAAALRRRPRGARRGRRLPPHPPERCDAQSCTAAIPGTLLFRQAIHPLAQPVHLLNAVFLTH